MVRRLGLALLFALACAHVQSSQTAVPAAWHELTSEHFTVFSDVPEDKARRAVADMELVRNALAELAWTTSKVDTARYQVVLLQSQEELREFAFKGLGGFATSDAFGEPILVVTADQDVIDDTLFKHELTHLIDKQFMVTKPRWVDEGIATYLESLQIDARRNRLTVGLPEGSRLKYLATYPMKRAFAVLQQGAEIETTTQEAAYAFETYSWLWVHWLADMKRPAFEDYLNRLAKGEETWAAFTAAFPGLREADVQRDLNAYFTQKLMRAGSAPLHPWSGTVQSKPMEAAEAVALRAELLGFHAGYVATPERRAEFEAEVRKALDIDPGNPLALAQTENGDPKPAIEKHPDDWRAWLLYADRNHADQAALDKARALAPQNPRVLLQYAMAEGHAGHVPEALKDAALAVDIAPGRSDILDGYAQLSAAAGKCTQAVELEKRALDSVSDAGASGVPAQLRERMLDLQNHCREQVTLTRSVMFTPVMKQCKHSMPGVTLKGPVKASFKLQKDGTVAEVKMTGEASPGVMNRLQKYVQSCTFVPLIIEGQAQIADASVTFTEPTK
jgi:tetratricopeptide (TPR) repeat protein